MKSSRSIAMLRFPTLTQGLIRLHKEGPMRSSENLADFVGEALRAGHDRATIAEELKSAGWSATEIASALHAWAATDFRPPVPRPRATVSAREAFSYGLLFIALLVTTFGIIDLGFDLIDRWIVTPDDTASRTTMGIRWSISYLAVFFPLFLILGQRIERRTGTDASRRRSPVRKWFGYIALFLAVMALLGDLVSVIYAFLNGSVTSRFLAKTVLVAVTASAVVVYIRRMTEDPQDSA